MESVDYEKVIADLEHRRAAFNASIDAAIQAIRSVLAASGAAGPVQWQGRPADGHSNGGTLTPDMLFGKAISEASIICLQTFKKPMTPQEIVEALEGAKYHHQSKNFVNTVNSILNRRADNVGDVVKVGRTWALADWYPGRRRAPRSQQESVSTPDAVQAETNGDVE